MSNRTRFSVDPITGNVTVRWYDAWSEEWVTTTYWAPSKFGYVRIVDRAGNRPQVCEMLYRTGNTLMASKSTLLDVLRRELRRRRRHEAALDRRRCA